MTRSKETEQRLSYLDLSDDDRERLAALEPLLTKHADEFVDVFYRHLLSFTPTRQLLSDPEVKRRLFEKQREYFMSLAGPVIDDDYVEHRRQIGEVHERIGLSTRWYLGAYSLYFSILVPLICEEFSEDPHEAARTIISLQKILTLDSQLALETYIQRRERELEYMAEELAREGRRMAREYRDQSTTLRHTRERAQAAEELASIATLVAGLAHEIGTPMGVIQGHAKMLEPAVSDPAALWRVKTIQEQIGRISRIIQTLLNMARPRRSQRAPVALEPLLDNTLSFLSEKLANRGIEVVRAFEPVRSVAGDSERLQQLFLNLAFNAADAMPEGGSLRIELGPAEDAVHIRIQDSGMGIPAADLGRVFEPFFTTKEAGQGNGLGLMVCQGIVHDHGGSIEVESSEGHGTVFEILLPVIGAKIAKSAEA